MRAFTTFTAILSVAGAALASCSQADRFGVTTVSNGVVKPGDLLQVSTDFSCSSQFSIEPTAAEYAIVASSDSGCVSQEIFLTRRESKGQNDAFSVKLPRFPKYKSDASYSLLTRITYTLTDTDGQAIQANAGSLTPLTITA